MARHHAAKAAASDGAACRHAAASMKAAIADQRKRSSGGRRQRVRGGSENSGGAWQAASRQRKYENISAAAAAKKQPKEAEKSASASISVSHRRHRSGIMAWHGWASKRLIAKWRHGGAGSVSWQRVSASAHLNGSLPAARASAARHHSNISIAAASARMVAARNISARRHHQHGFSKKTRQRQRVSIGSGWRYRGGVACRQYGRLGNGAARLAAAAWLAQLCGATRIWRKSARRRLSNGGAANAGMASASLSARLARRWRRMPSFSSYGYLQRNGVAKRGAGSVS